MNVEFEYGKLLQRSSTYSIMNKFKHVNVLNKLMKK